MTFEEYKKVTAQPDENIKDSVFFIQEYYVKNITELLENKHCKCELVSCGFTQKFSKSKVMIRKKYTNSKYLFNNLDAISFFTISECNYDGFISPYIWSREPYNIGRQIIWAEALNIVKSKLIKVETNVTTNLR